METIAPGVWRLRLGEPEEYTPVSMKQVEIDEDRIARLPDPGMAPFARGEVGFKVTPRGCVVELPLHPAERIYGFGLQLKSVDHTGRRRQLRVNSDPITDTGDSHAPVPFYISTAGYGIFVDTARYAIFNCGTHSRVPPSSAGDALTGEPAGAPVGGLPAGRGSFKSMIVEIPVARGVDIYIFGGPGMREAVQRYVLFSGGGCLPPYWGLGVWYRAYGKANSDDIARLAREIRESGIPCDVFGLEPGWQSHAYSCSFVWDKERFPAPDQLVQDLTRMGFKINLWEHVFTHPSSPIYDQLKQYAGEYEVWGGLVPDLSLDGAREVFGGYHKKEFVDKGVKGFKLDECDSSDFNRDSWSFPTCSEFPSGLDGEQMHSLLGILYQETIMSVFRKNNIRTYSQVRSSHALAACLPFVLYSDLYDHRDFIRGVVNMGFSGLLWAPEVRQCDSAEDLIRRIQTVVFSPQALVNAWLIPHPPWMQYDTEVQEICRRFFELRMSLLPYLYSSFARYHFEGVPPFRALVMDYPGDGNVYGIDDEYMMGDSILVAPMVAGQDVRQVYLPQGNWYSFWTGEKFQGGKTHRICSSLDTMPVFVREGALLPIARPVRYITPDTRFEVTVRAHGQDCRDTLLFEDDGFTFRFENGEYNIVRLGLSSDGRLQVERSGYYRDARYIITGLDRVM
ncbi:MAG TPA: glycoside hydrolase [Firmicutes bacterium]|nr:glycoside hydrolase [Bacillota bacterium]